MRNTAIILCALALSSCALVQDKIAEKIIERADAAPAVVVPAGTEPAPAALPLRATIVAHLANAAAIAKAADDAPGVACWTTLGRWVETLPLAKTDPAPDPVLPEATGPSGRIELARIKSKLLESRVNAVKARVAALRGIIDAGVPDDVVTACAVVVHDARSIVSRLLNVIGLAGL